MQRVAGFLAWLPLAAVLAIGLVVPAGLAIAASQPRAAAPVVVITAPWRRALPVATRAGGLFLGPGRIQAVTMAWSDNPGFTGRLYDNGAWLVLDGSLAGFLCESNGV